MSKLLDEYWHATARAPRRFPGDHYDLGLDVLGGGLALSNEFTKTAQKLVTAAAAPKASNIMTAGAFQTIKSSGLSSASTGKPSTIATAAAAGAAKAAGGLTAATEQKTTPDQRTQITAAGNRATAAGQKLQTRRPGTARKLISHGKRVGQKATTIVGGQWRGITAEAFGAWKAIVAATNAVAQAGEIENQVLAVVDQLKVAGLTDLANSGQAIASRCDDVVNNFDPDNPDTSVTATVASIQSDASTWTSSATSALSAAPSTAAAGAPTITSLSTTAGAAGDPVTFTGTNLDKVTAVDFGGVPSQFSASSATQLSTTVPQNATTGPVHATSPGGTAVGPTFSVSFAYGTAGGGGGGGDDGGGGPSGGGGGGSGGGGGYADDGDSEGMAEEEDAGQAAVRRFRESGGEWDPFADTDSTDDGGAVDSGYADDEGTATEEGESVMGHDFDWRAIFYDPAGELYRSQSGSSPIDFQTHVATHRQGQPSADVAARLAESKRRFAALQQRLSTFYAQRAAGAPIDTGASMQIAPTDDSVQGEDEPLVSEVADIILEQFQHQITDDEPDPERQPASAHRGAAYLQDLAYPPGGASSGQEGGSVMPEEKLVVLGAQADIVFGSGYARGMDALGAGVRGSMGSKVVPRVPPRAGVASRVTPGGRTMLSLQVPSPKAHDHKSSIKNARDVAKHAATVASQASKVAVVQTKPTSGKSTKVHGAPVRGSTKRPLVPAAKLKSEAVQLKKDADKLKKRADGHEQKIKASVTKLRAGVKAAQTRLRGDDDETTAAQADYEAALHEATYEDLVLGDAEMWDDVFGADPDPSTLDPNAPSDGMPMDAGLPGPPDYGLGPAPTEAPPLQAGVDYIPDPGPDSDVNTYSSDPNVPGVSLPIGYVAYDGSVKMPFRGVGSYSAFFGQVPGSRAPDGGQYSGSEWHDDGWYWFWASAYNDGVSIDKRLNKDTDSSPGSMVWRAKGSLDHAWGPMIGNPHAADSGHFQGGAPWTRGLRYDAGGNQWFWYRDMAPDWATAADRMDRLNQAVLDYQAQLTAAKTDYINQQMQDRIDAETAKQVTKQQAAELQATQHQVDVDQAQAQGAAQTQQLADEAVYRQMQQQADVEAQQASAQADIESKQMLTQAEIDRQAAEEAAAIDQRAAETAARLQAMQPPEDEEGGGEEGSDEGMSFNADAAREALDNEEPTIMGTAKLRMRRGRHG